MTMEWALLPIRRYSEFSGRSRRKEFWSFHLMLFILSLIASAIDGALGTSALVLGLYGLLTFLLVVVVITPQLTVSIRRLHDTDRSGWWLLLAIVPPVVMGVIAFVPFGWLVVALATAGVAVFFLSF